MAHKCEYEAKVTYINAARIIVTYYAKWKDKRLDVLQHEFYIEGPSFEFVRTRDNLRYSSMGGYLVAFPGEKEIHNYYYGNGPVEEYPYEISNKMPGLYFDGNEEIIEKIKETYPEFKYLIDKAAAKKLRYDKVYKFMQLATMTKKTSIIEWLIEHNQISLITENNIKHNLKPEILSFIKENVEQTNMDIRAVKLAIKEKVDYDTAKIAVDYFCGDIRLQEYLESQKEEYKFYRDYKEMCKELGKDWNDPYWRYPKKLRDAHYKVFQEINELKEMEKLKEQQIIQEKLNKKEEAYNKYLYHDQDYAVYFPFEIEDIKKHAEDLHQCLIRCDYHKKYAEGRTILIFIKEHEKSIATAEISSQKEIIQFYMDEKDHDNCKPTEKIKQLMSKFLNTLPNRVRI